MTEPAGVVVTMAQIYTELRSLNDEVRKLSATMSPAVQQTADHENRIRDLERRVWTTTALAIGGGGVLGAALAIVPQVLGAA